MTACTIFVAGRAQTEDGGPVTGALVRLRSAEAGDDELRRVSVDGRFEFVHPKLRGPFEVIAELPGYAPARYAPCGLGSSEVFLQLVRPTSVIEGHLLDARGEAVAFQWIRFVPVDGGMNVAVMTSSEGRFRTDGVRDVDYDAILVRAEGVSSPMRRTHGGDLQIELRLPR